MLIREYLNRLAHTRPGLRRLVEQEMAPAEDAPIGDATLPNPETASDPQAALAIRAAIKEAGWNAWEAVCDGSLEIGIAIVRLKKLAAFLDKAEAAVSATESVRRPSWDDKPEAGRVSWVDEPASRAAKTIAE